MRALILAGICGVLLSAGLVSAGTYEDDIADRIKKIGSVCVRGDDCAAAAPAGASDSASASGGVEANYNGSCATCHAIGLAGAPKLGDIAAWEPRLEKGMDVLYASGINGLAPGMPAKGMCFTCSDDDIKALVDYMVNSVK